MTAPESKLMSAFFAAQALHGSYKDAKAAEDAYRSGNNEEATRYATESILGGAMGVAAGAHAVSEIKLPADKTKPEFLPPEETGIAAPSGTPGSPPTIEGVRPGTTALAPFRPLAPEYNETPIANYRLVYRSPAAKPADVDNAVRSLMTSRESGSPEELAAAAQRLRNLNNSAIGQIRQLPSGESIVYLNRAGLEDLSAGLRGGEPNPDYSLNGVSIRARYIPAILRNLFILNTPHSRELTNLLLRGRGENGDVVVSAVPQKDETLSQALSRLREELNHGWQKQFLDATGNHLPPADDKVLNSQIPQPMRDYLYQMGYPKDDDSEDANRMRVMEASSKMMSGAPGEFALTEDEVAPFLFQYFDAVTKQHGPQALDQLIHTTTLARHMKEDYARARFPNRGTESGGALPGVSAQRTGRNQGGAPTASGSVAPGAGGTTSQPADLTQLNQTRRPQAPAGPSSLAELKEEAEKRAPWLQAAARGYSEREGLPVNTPDYALPDVRAKDIADAYEAMKHTPDDPAVRASYDAMKRDLEKQWDYAVNEMGVKFEPWTKPGQPYKNSAEMAADVDNNHHLYFYQGGDMSADHPLAEIDPKTGYTFNDMLRAVHDLYGHAG
ncbi:MAG TPA: hypothetical protein VFW94_24285 [Candidatus Acidoferrales bacterium]|nr:hypothetical protein [Candidatus Acidoferrales bacterium]